MTTPDMPIHLAARDDPDTTVPVKPDTNEARLLRYLVTHADYGFSPRELAEETEMPHGTVTKTLRRLLEKGVVEQTPDGYYYAPPEQLDRLRSHLTSLRSLAMLHEQFGDDWYGQTPGWADDLPDLGTDTVPDKAIAPAQNTPVPAQVDEQELPDLGTDDVPADQLPDSRSADESDE
jgi:DNA-binding transcriptional ArsR family regulator